MQPLQEPLVSIIIPVYNGEDYLRETLDSIFSQEYTNWELIIVNDGSVDNSEQIVKGITDQRVHYHYKVNAGVSSARNWGFAKAKGEYVVFFDADDIMSAGFLRRRVEVLEKNKEVGFACGWVLKIDQEGQFFGGVYRAACEDVQREVLTFSQDIITCPSNYMFRRNLLENYKVRYNTRLFSSADKFFLLQMSRHVTGVLISQPSELYYRIRRDSMSNKLSLRLIRDNETYHRLVLREFKPDAVIRRSFRSKSFYLLSGGYWGLRKIWPSLKYGLKAFLMNPVYFVTTFTK